MLQQTLNSVFILNLRSPLLPLGKSRQHKWRCQGVSYPDPNVMIASGTTRVDSGSNMIQHLFSRSSLQSTWLQALNKIVIVIVKSKSLDCTMQVFCESAEKDRLNPALPGSPHSDI